MGADSSLVIVKVNEKVLLLGVAQQHITLLQELDAELYRMKSRRVQMERPPRFPTY